MQIDPRNVPSPHSVQRTQGPTGVSRSKSRERDGAPGRSEVELSARAQLAQAARAALADAAPPAERRQRMAELQKLVQSGEYSVPAGDLARRLWNSGAIRW